MLLPLGVLPPSARLPAATEIAATRLTGRPGPQGRAVRPLHGPLHGCRRMLRGLGRLT